MAIAVVQSGSIPNAFSGSLSQATGAGNTLFLLPTSFSTSNVAISSSGPSLGGVTTGWTNPAAELSGYSSNEVYGAAWMKPSIAGGQSAVSISVPNGSLAAVVGLMYAEVSGLGSSPFLDGTAGIATGNSTAVSSGPTSLTTQLAEFILGLLVQFNGLPTLPGAPWTSQGLSAANNSVLGYQISSSTGTFTFSGTQGSAGEWIGLCMAIAPGNATVTLVPQAQRPRTASAVSRIRRPQLQGSLVVPVLPQARRLPLRTADLRRTREPGRPPVLAVPAAVILRAPVSRRRPASSPVRSRTQQAVPAAVILPAAVSHGVTGRRASRLAAKGERRVLRRVPPPAALPPGMRRAGRPQVISSRSRLYRGLLARITLLAPKRRPSLAFRKTRPAQLPPPPPAGPATVFGSAALSASSVLTASAVCAALAQAALSAPSVLTATAAPAQTNLATLWIAYLAAAERHAQLERNWRMIASAARTDGTAGSIYAQLYTADQAKDAAWKAWDDARKALYPAPPTN